MGKRSGVLDHEADIIKLSLDELDEEIERCETRLKIAEGAYQCKSFKKRIHWLKKIRVRQFEGNEE